MVPETSARNHHYTLCNSPEGRSFHLLRGGSLKSQMALFASSVSWLRVTTKLETSRGAKNSQRVAWYVQLSFIHSVFCLTTGPKPPPKRCLHIVRSRASSFKWEYLLLSLRSSSSFLRLLPRLLVTSISPFIFPSITCFRRQFLRKMWPIQLAFLFLISFPYYGPVII